MKANYETRVIIIPVNGMTDGRKVLEGIENEKFDDVQGVLNKMCYDEFNPLAEEDVSMLDLCDFMDWFNDIESISEVWMGYVQIKV